jgi:predicted DsbA family dithiol-disulfide isomerase
MAELTVDIWSDVVCPWCYIGKRRFEAALEQFEHRDDVTVLWHSFELDPEAPPVAEGKSAERLAEKYGMSVEEAAGRQAEITTLAAQDGLTYDLAESRGGNTFDAHRLVHLAEAHGVQDAMKERLMRAYLTEGELMSDHATLERLATEVGLPADEVRDMLATDRFAAGVRDDERTATSFGISAVPFFVVDRRIGAAGAQPPEVLGELLRRAWADRPAIPVVAGGDTCGIDGC